ncbi:LLM class flavin-dependent oxidoreductase [Tissierella sp.]|uniref:LLM class flavin-dependent oxidoreductase n=1 Tax=Tissierella sp. TaxID=41274 RepID=UPI0028B0DC32|nr:LLM class flavin-dependent oxidoreductase [Tissierella sp.]
MDIKNEIKSYIVKSGYTMTEIIEMVNKKYNKTDTVQNLSNKLTRGTIRYNEVLEIADICGYNIEWIEKNKE